ncbi:MAG TPA: hypothetical protein VIJ62_11930 [Rhizomicrobium sp.]
MSEFTNTRATRADIHWQLLTTVSAFALVASICTTGEARAADSDHPLVWIELDGQFAQEENSQEAFLPPFMLASPFDGAAHTGVEKGSPAVWDRGAKVTFQPSGSDWVLLLGARYGKSSRSETREGHPTTASITKYNGHYSAYQHFAGQNSDSHIILDFQAGKDFGLGRIGSGGSSLFSAGIRFAQFDSRSHAVIKSQPTNLPTGDSVNKFYASFAAKRKFTGVGPSMSWDAFANLTGNSSAGSITFDWGLNGAVLFGRQRTSEHHQTTEIHFNHYYITKTPYQHSASPPEREKNVAVPNLGGFAGVSWRYPIAKVSVGYRADMFFGAIDGGIDSVHRESRGFYGPFASVSVGFGG